MAHPEAIPPGEGEKEVESSTKYGPWSLFLFSGNENSAYLSPIPSQGPDAVQVVIKKSGGQAAWEIQLQQTGPAAVADRTSVLHFRARADARRRIEIGFTRATEPWTDLGLHTDVTLTPEWESFREQFTMTADADRTQIIFNLGNDETAVEVARVGLRTVGGAPLQDHSGPPAPSPARGPAGTLNRPIHAAHARSLQGVSTSVLTAEILARIQEGAFNRDEESVLLGCELQYALRDVLDVSRNRWSRRRYREQFEFYPSFLDPWPALDGATVLDLGCGALNPYGASFMFLMMGARRGIAVDLDEILDVSRAVRALADLAAMMLIDPKSIIADFPITRAEMLRNIASFDLPSLAWGEPEGIDADRLLYLRESVHSLSLADGEVDFVFSNATLEHLDRAEAAIAELARITRPGGVGVHIVDASDHWTYSDPAHHPLEFLTDPSPAPLLHGSNRIRPMEFLPMFERHGFEVLSFLPFRRAEIPEKLLKRLAAPWRGIAPETLAILDGRICVRRRL